MPSPTFTNDYAPTGKADRARVREEAGHRCIRCGHPYQTGLKRADRGEWSDCDEQCDHGGMIRLWLPEMAMWQPIEWAMHLPKPCTMVQAGRRVQAQWRILTVHHFDGDKANDAWWNLLSLCQKCHLSVQSRVNPEIPWMFEHSTWLRPFVAGFYAKKYLGLDLTREQVIARLDELLALECKTP